MSRLLPLLLGLLAALPARAADDCVPLEAAVFRAEVARAHDALLDDDPEGHDAIVLELARRVPCLVDLVPTDAWARLLYEDAVVRQAEGRPWQHLVSAALAADPLLDRALGALEVRAFQPVRGGPEVARPDDVPERWWVDGRPADAVLLLGGPHVLQRRDGSSLRSALVDDGAPLPAWWAPEPAPAPVPEPSPAPDVAPAPAPEAAPTPEAAPAPAPATPPEAVGAAPRLVLRVHAATGLHLLVGKAYDGGAISEPALKLVVPVEAGLELDVPHGWVRLHGELTPLVNGTWAYDQGGTSHATRIGGGLALAGGGRVGIGHVGALVGGRDPSRLVFQAVGGAQVHDSGLRVELRAGVDVLTTRRVEPAFAVLLVFAPRVWAR